MHVVARHLPEFWKSTKSTSRIFDRTWVVTFNQRSDPSLAGLQPLKANNCTRFFPGLFFFFCVCVCVAVCSLPKLASIDRRPFKKLELK